MKNRYIYCAGCYFLIFIGLISVCTAASPNPVFYNGISEAHTYDPFGVVIGYDVTVYIINNGEPGDVFYRFYKTTSAGEYVYSSKVFGMNAGERVDVMTHFSHDPGTFTGYHSVRTAGTGDGTVGDLVIFRRDAPPSISVTTPPDGDEWYSSHVYRISWQYTGEPGSTVTIDILNATSTKRITQSVPIGNCGYGYYDWTIPTNQTPGNGYKIRITSDTGYTDTSNTGFSVIKPSITVISPDGGEILERGKISAISWTYHDDPRYDSRSTVSINLYKDGISPHWLKNAPIGRGGSGSYSWKIPSDVNPGINYTIRVSNPGAMDDSNSAFSIRNPDVLTVSYPDGRENLYTGQHYTIEWFYPERLGGEYATVELLKAGNVERIIGSNLYMASDGFGFDSWTIPADVPLGNDYTIRINSTSGASDKSDAVFTIGQPSIAVTAPKGGELWASGKTYDITWDFAGIDWWETITLELLKSGTVDRIIRQDYPLNMPAYYWSIPANLTPGSDYKVRITTTSGYSNTSEHVFSISVPQPAVPASFRVGVYRPSAHTFYLKNTTTTAINWGISTDLPVTGDWNGDGRTDVGVYRPSAHTFYLKNGTITTAINWGASTDLPVTGDWNGDRMTDVGVYRPSAHTFYLKNGTRTTAINWGTSTDLPVTGDWNGDGTTDVGVYRPSAHTFYVKNGITTAINWGASTDLPVTGDWNGDRITDVGVYRPSAHMFYLKNGTRTTAINWGTSTDLPVTGKW